MKKIYFLSDAHLGSKTFQHPLEQEKRLVRFLDSIKEDAKALYLLGDIIDFWYEFKTVVPRGFTRFFGKIAELTDRGIEVHWFTGNHDIWLFDYLPAEIGVIIHRQTLVADIDGKKVLMAHGDGLGDDSTAYQFMHRFFRNRLCQRLFSAVHPRWTVAFAHNWSRHSRLTGGDNGFNGEDNERLVSYAKEVLKTQHIDYFIFGHRHIMLDLMIARDSRVLILGDWISLYSYAVMQDGQIWLEQFESDNSEADETERNGVSIAF